MLGLELSPEVHALVVAWCGRPRGSPEAVRAEAEQAIAQEYRRVGRRAPRVAWCESPGRYLAAVKDPRAEARWLLRRRPLVVRWWRWRPRWLRALTAVVTALLASVVVLLACLGGWLLVTVLTYRAVMSLLDQPVGADTLLDNLVFLICLLVPLVAARRVLSAALGITLGVRRALARRVWWAVVPGLEIQAPPWHGLRGLVVALAPPTEVERREVEGHEVLTARWPDGVRHLFVDGVRVPWLPRAGEAGRQGELFGRDWAERHLTIPEPDPEIETVIDAEIETEPEDAAAAASDRASHRAAISRAVDACYAALGLEPPALLWCRTWPEYDAALRDPLARLAQAGDRDRLPAAMATAALRRQQVLARPGTAAAIAWTSLAVLVGLLVGWWFWLAYADPAFLQSATGRVVGLLGVPVALFVVMALTTRPLLAGVRAGRTRWAGWLLPLEGRVTARLSRGPRPGAPADARAVPQLSAPVAAADLFGALVRRSFPPVTVASWRWQRAVRLAAVPPEPTGSPARERGEPQRAEALLGALEATAAVPWTARRRVAVLLQPPSVVWRGWLATPDGGRRLPTASLGWPDGSWWHLVDGVRVPRPAESGEWTVAEIHAVPNSEARRVLIETMGWDRYLAQARLPVIAEVPDPANPPHRLRLYRLDDAGWDDLSLLVMANASPGPDGRVRRFAEFVPARFEDPVEAAAWQYGVSVEVYRRLQRRT